MSTQICIRWFVVAMAAGISAYAGAEVADPPEPTAQDVVAADRQLRWIQRVQQAATLLAGGKPAEALADYQAIVREMPDMDRDGLVAVAIGDCHWHLEQYELARQAYDAALQKHPQLAAAIRMRQAETDLAAGRFEQGEQLLREVQAGGDDPEMRSWAALRLAMAQERRVIRLLEQIEEAYRQTAKVHAGRSPGSWRWRETHADDLKETIGQLRAALAQMDEWQRIVPVLWTDKGETTRAARVELGRVRIAAALRPPRENELEVEPAGSKAIELVVEKGVNVEVRIAGRRVELDEASKRQVLKHLEQAVRLASNGQEPVAE